MELTIKEVCAFYACSKETGRARVKEIKKGLHLPPQKKRILMFHLAKYEGLTTEEVKQIINLEKTDFKA